MRETNLRCITKLIVIVKNERSGRRKEGGEERRGGEERMTNEGKENK